jgi:predicted small lipoprotein YifL
MSPRVISWASLPLPLLLAASLLACGREGPPRPPEDVVPQTISDLTATNVAAGVQLSWSRPLHYADGERMTDLGGFIVERAVGTEARVAFRRLTVLEVSDRDRFRQLKRFQFVDGDTAAGTTYQYRLVSSTVDRYFSAPSNVVTITRTVPGEEAHAPLSGTQR